MKNTGLSLIDIVLILAVALVVIVVASTSPMAGDFAWSDAPRHGLNGIFLLDALRALPFEDPRAWAEAYYLKYPALTILFYPPLFSGVLAFSYSLFGFSHETAQWTVVVFHVAAGVGLYVLARNWLSPVLAFSAAIAFVAAPEFGLWARQVMLDAPAFAWLIWSVVFLFRYVRSDQTVSLVLAAAFFACALYTKQTAVFAALPMMLLLVRTKGFSFLWSRRALVLGAVFLLAMVPLVLLQLKYGAVNTASVLGSARDDMSRLSLVAWTYYLSVMPLQLGWPLLLLGAGYLAAALVSPSWRIDRPAFQFLVAWVGTGYLLFSLIMVREPRHDLMALWPIAVFAMLMIDRAMRHWGTRASQAIGCGVAVLVAGFSVFWSVAVIEVPYVKGYRQVAALVGANSPPRSNVLFSGYRDGSFIFNVRALDRSDLGVIRADKLLLRVAIERERGVEERDVRRAEVVDYFPKYRIRYVVAQRDFWQDLDSMAMLNEVLSDPDLFARVETVEPVANYNNSDAMIDVYRYLGDIADEPAPLTLDMVGIGETFSQ